MKAMVLAAGKGTRLFPLTGESPKPLAPVADTPIIEHIFNLLSEYGTEEVYVNVYYLADQLLETYGRETHLNGMRVRLSREEKLMGTAGGVKRLAENFDEETFLVVSGDALTDVDIRELVAFHQEKEALATLALQRVYDTSEFGVVELDEKNNILSFQEKPAATEAISTLANTGIYVLEPEVLNYIAEDTFVDFAKDVFPALLAEAGRLVGYEGDFYWSDIGTLESYRQAQYDALSGKAKVRIPGEQQGDGVWVGKNAQVHPSATLEGGVFVGEDAVIGRDAVLSGHVTVGRDCWIRPGATIKGSVLLPGGTVGDGAYLENCIVGYGYDVRPRETIRGGALIRATSYRLSSNDSR